MAQQIKISLVADNQTQPAQRGVDALEKKIEELEKEWKKAGDASAKSGTQMQASSQKATASVNNTNKSLFNMGSVAKTVTGALVSVFAVQQIADFAKNVFRVTAEFQKFEAVLTNTLGSNSEAQLALASIQKFASETPFSVQELTGAFVKLANQGFKPTTEEMRLLGDLAASTGKDFDQLAEAIIDAQTGEFERLKEFGVRAKKEGDNVKFTFKGVETTVKATSEAIREYVTGLGKIEGVSGSMAAISKTLTGQVSNLGDSFDQLYATIGGQSEGIFVSLIGFVNDTVTAMTNLLKTTEQLGKEFSAKESETGLSNAAKLFEEIGRSAKQSGEDVTEAVGLQKEALKILYQQELDAATKSLEKFQEQNETIFGRDNGAATIVRYFQGGVAGVAGYKGELSLLSGEVEKYKTLLGALDNVQQKTVDKLEQEGKAAVKTKDELDKLLAARMKELKELEDLAIREAELEGKSNTQIHLIELAFNEERLKTLRNFGKKATNEYKSYTLEQKEIIKENEKELREIILRSHDKRYKDQQDFNKIMKSAQDKSIDDLVAKEEWAAEQRDKLKREEAERKKQIEEESYNVSVQFMDALFQIGRDRNQQALADNDARRQEELKRVGDDAQAKAFINAKFDRENAKLKQKQAVADKANALFGIAINTAMAIVKQLATTPLPVGAPLVALIAASGAIQAALVASRPIPKYKEGTEFVRRLNGEPMGRDTILAHIDEGERIVPREINRQLTGIKNSELPRLARVAKEEKIMVAEFRELVAQQRETNRTLKNLKLYRTELTEQGIVHTVESNNARTKILNEQFSL